VTIAVTPTQDQTLKALGDFIAGVLVAGIEVVVGQVNRVPEPDGNDFVVMWPLLRERISTNIDDFDSVDGETDLLQPIQLTVQIDVHGPSSADNTQIITTLFRDPYGVNALQALNENITPLFTSEPRQMPFTDGEQQLEERWIIEVNIEVNQTVVVPQDSATVVEIDVINVEATYP
jgi:hypothetical protein